MNSIVILQARTSSTRLPGKVLLPIGGLPIVVLAARRASNTGRNVIVATSNESSDDGLAEILRAHNIRFFRGSLNDTLGRIVSALVDYSNDTIVFRLTADNVFPDGALLDELEHEFSQQNLDYLCCNGEQSGLPYGMSAEVTLLSHLRQAEKESVDCFDREHVTPYIRKIYGAKYFTKHKQLGFGHLRCTIDCLDDYLGIQRLFLNVNDPVSVPSFELIDKLKSGSLQPLLSNPVPRLVFGAAQLGANYGIANTTGQPNFQDSQHLLKLAIANGVIHIDTARAYGNSEEVIGRALSDGWGGRAKIITKLSPLTDCPPDALNTVVDAFVDASFFQSLSALGTEKIDVLLLHRVDHLHRWGGRVWDRLLQYQLDGKIGELGVSVQTPEELTTSLEVPQVGYIQLPFNVLDWRWEQVIPKLIEVKSSRKLTVHVRSALLQGLLPSTDAALWRRANVDDPSGIHEWLSNSCAKFGSRSVASFCINFVNSLSWIDGIALGMERIDQLIENIKIFNEPPISASDLQEIKASRPILSKATLNPAEWKIKEQR